MKLQHHNADELADSPSNAEIVEYLNKELEGSVALDNWHRYGEGYSNLAKAVRMVVQKLGGVPHPF
jgi:hypothetical protein